MIYDDESSLSEVLRLLENVVFRYGHKAIFLTAYHPYYVLDGCDVAKMKARIESNAVEQNRTNLVSLGCIDSGLL